MSEINRALPQLNKISEMAEANTLIHKIHPMVKLATTMVYLIAVVSFPYGEISGLWVYFFYPAFLITLAEIPFNEITKRTVIALPFAVCAGISNVFFDNNTAAVLFGVEISYGWMSFLGIVIKTLLSVTAVLILASTTRLTAILKELTACKVPKLFVTQFMLTFRYLEVLTAEAGSMRTAYVLRYPKAKGIKFKDMGAFLGNLVLRSIERSERIYNAMSCRGFNGSYPMELPSQLTLIDLLYFVVVAGMAVIFRFIDFGILIESFIG